MRRWNMIRLKLIIEEIIELEAKKKDLLNELEGTVAMNWKEFTNLSEVIATIESGSRPKGGVSDIGDSSKLTGARTTDYSNSGFNLQK
ncbi:MAG: hypothetical protein U5Q03_00055 [Bacteroidota bacterium]|nr:hypothetical protein [Bacteroidota bacterium]